MSQSRHYTLKQGFAMKLLINALILQERNTGLGVYTYNVLEHILPKLVDAGVETRIMCRKKAFLPANCQDAYLEVDYHNFVQRNKIVDKYATGEYDLLWSTTQHGSLRAKCPQIITIHDLTPLFYPKGRIHQYLYYRFLLRRIIKKSKAVITVSENTKKDICNVYKCSADKVINAQEFIADEHLHSPGIKFENHFNIVGIHYPYKNLHTIITAYYEYDDLRKYTLYIIGDHECKYGKSLQKLVNKYTLQKSIKFTGFLSGESKNKIIKSSFATIYPSKYEGFGLPLLESMSMGVPVLSSSASSLPEVGGDAAVYFDPDSTKSFYNAFSRLAESDRESIIEKGFSNIKRFSWDTTTTIILDEILKLMKRG